MRSLLSSLFVGCTVLSGLFANRSSCRRAGAIRGSHSDDLGSRSNSPNSAAHVRQPVFRARHDCAGAGCSMASTAAAHACAFDAAPRTVQSLPLTLAGRFPTASSRVLLAKGWFSWTDAANDVTPDASKARQLAFRIRSEPCTVAGTSELRSTPLGEKPDCAWTREREPS